MEPVDPSAARRAEGRETVLLVEDSDLVRGIVRHILVRGGYTVLEAAGGEEALELCRTREGPVDLLLTDMVMPHMEGIELARRVAAARPFTRVLCMSGASDGESDGFSRLPEGMRFIRKPFTPDDLIRTIREILGTR